MEGLVITGGYPLRGEVEVSGAKNAALPILAATVIAGGQYTLHNCPCIEDVAMAAKIIQSLGGHVRCMGHTLEADTTGVCRWSIPAELMEKMRASVLFLGPLLARFGRAELTMPGGCPLGKRPIDLHLKALYRMGVQTDIKEGRICCSCRRLAGAGICLPFPSVGATENILLAAVGCCSSVTVSGAAREPEIGDLVEFLRAAGAEIHGDGTDELTVCGGTSMRSTEYTILPDRIETATYLCAAAGCGGDVVIRRTDCSLLPVVLDRLEQAGCTVRRNGDMVHLTAPDRLSAPPPVKTAPYPGFPTDAQAVMMAAVLRAQGCTRFSEQIFEGRMGHAAQFRRLGACVEVTGTDAVVKGVPLLTGACLQPEDLRAAAASVIAALQAQGNSLVLGLNHLKRGYDNLEGNLQKLGARIKLVTGNRIDHKTTGNFCDYGV